MSDDGTPSALLRQLRLMAVADPRAARNAIRQLFERKDGKVAQFLDLISAPGETRLRHMVALTVRGRPERDAIVPHLLRWRATESDDLTRRAVEAALEGVDPAAFPAAIPVAKDTTDKGIVSPEALGIYRWFASRLCHRVRNGLMDPVTAISRLERLLRALPEQAAVEAGQELTRLKQALTRVSRIVEFDIGDGYLQWRDIPLWTYISDLVTRFNARYGAATVRVVGSASRDDIRVRATSMLLETIFWNLFKNAAQVSDGNCEMSIGAEWEGESVRLILRDNGPGFSNKDVAEAFVIPFSSKGETGGRGLLEVADAVGRLNGSIELATDHEKLRIRLLLPTVKR